MRVSLFGCGYYAERLYYEIVNKNLADVIYIFDNFAKGKFHNIEIRKPDPLALKEYPVCIAIGDLNVYEQIRTQLDMMGMKEFEDFYWKDALFKKIVVINANCYGPVIGGALRRSENFNMKYMIYDVPAIHENEKGYIDENLLKNCDVFIHQDIQPTNSFGYKFSDEYCKTFLKEGVLDICIPNLAGMGKCVFYNCEANNERNRCELGSFKYGLFPYSDGNIDELISRDMDSEKIIDVLSNSDHFDNNLIKENCKNIFDKYKEREKDWDIKIIDYIWENFRYKKCFYDLYHPTEFIFIFIVLQLFSMLGVESGIEEIYVPSMDDIEMPIYPGIGKALGLEYMDIEIRKSPRGAKLCSHMKLDEYIKEYIFWCFN